MSLDILSGCRSALCAGRAGHEAESVDGQRHLVVARRGKGLAAIEALQFRQLVIMRLDGICDGQQHGRPLCRGCLAETLERLACRGACRLDLCRAGLIDAGDFLAGRRIQNRCRRAVAGNQLSTNQHLCLHGLPPLP